MEDIGDTIKYWWLVVFWPATKFAIPFSDLKDRVMNIVVSLLVALAPVFALHSISQIQGIGVNIQTVFVWLGVAIVCRFIFASVYFPAMEHKKLGGFLGSPLQVTAMPQKPLIGVERWASVLVTNSTSFRVENCTLTLQVAIDELGNDLLRTSERLTWSGRDQTPDDRGDRPKMIVGKGWRVCDVAQTQNELNRAVFTTWFNNNQTVQAGRYRITIESNGELATQNGSKGFSDQYQFWLIYNGGYDLQIEQAKKKSGSKKSVR